MANGQQTPKKRVIFLGKTEDERIGNAQMFQIGLAIMQRFGQNFTPDERAFMDIALSHYASIVEPEGVEQPEQPASPKPPLPPVKKSR